MILISVSEILGTSLFHSSFYLVLVIFNSDNSKYCSKVLLTSNRRISAFFTETFQDMYADKFFTSGFTKCRQNRLHATSEGNMHVRSRISVSVRGCPNIKFCRYLEAVYSGRSHKIMYSHFCNTLGAAVKRVVRTVSSPTFVIYICCTHDHHILHCILKVNY